MSLHRRTRHVLPKVLVRPLGDGRLHRLRVNLNPVFLD